MIIAFEIQRKLTVYLVTSVSLHHEIQKIQPKRQFSTPQRIDEFSKPTNLPFPRSCEADTNEQDIHSCKVQCPCFPKPRRFKPGRQRKTKPTRCLFRW